MYFLNFTTKTLLLIAFISIYTITIAQDCGYNASPEATCRWGLPHPSCSLDEVSEKCVKIKFHYINNTIGSINAPENYYYGWLIDEINKVFATSKIRFTFADECVHRTSKLLFEDSQVGSAQKIRSLLADSLAILLPVNERDPDLEYIEGFINVYFVQNMINRASGWREASLVVVKDRGSFSELIHEIGHTLGLSHTHRGNPQTLDCLCKDPEATNEEIPHGLHCEVVQDCLCDTGMDPQDNDLDGDSIADGDKWVDLFKCIQKPSLLSSISDGCNDTTSSWAIPYRNYMSYYDDCRNEFSMCQKSLMHEVLENLESDLLINCTTDPSFNCSNIYINEPTTWQNQTIEMCRGQRIIIGKSGSLTLDNTVLTISESPSPPSTLCADLIPLNLWDGIYIEGRSVDFNEVYGNLILINNSLIEFAENGINAPIRFGKILINNSTIQNCGKIIDARDIWPYSMPEEEPGSPFYYDLPESPGAGIAYCGYSLYNLPPVISINESTINCDEINTVHLRSTSQIKVSGSKLNINKSNFNDNTTLNLTAINHGKGRVSIINETEFDGFGIAVEKGADIFTTCAPGGLNITSSLFLNGSKIVNSSALVTLKNNVFQGDVRLNGLAYQTIIGNRFESNGLIINSPSESTMLRENYLDGTIITLMGKNMNTSLRCNTWNASNGYAVDIAGNTDLPMSWGTGQIGSGNIKTPEYEATISNYSQNSGVFPHYTNKPGDDIFMYEGFAEERDADKNDSICQYNIYPESPFSMDSVLHWDDIYTINELENAYDSISTVITQLQSQYENLSDLDAEYKLQEIDHTIRERNLIVGIALAQIVDADTSEALLWLSRTTSSLLDLSDLYTQWYRHDFSDMLLQLQSENTDDGKVFSDVVSWMNNKYASGLDIFSLSLSDLDTLTLFATSSFGNYTNLVRSFLHSEYDIHIPWPVFIAPRRSSGSISRTESDQTQLYQIVPNPVHKCFQVNKLINPKNEPIALGIYSMNGQLVLNKKAYTGEEVCISDLNQGMYFIKIMSDGAFKPEILLFVHQ